MDQAEAVEWYYTQFGTPGAAASPDQTIEMTIEKQNGALGGFNWSRLNREAFSMEIDERWYGRDCRVQHQTVTLA